MKDDKVDIPTHFMNQVGFGDESAIGKENTDYQPVVPVKDQPKPKPKKRNLDQAYDNWKSDNSQLNMGAVLKAATPVIDSAMRSYSSGADVRSKAKLLVIEAVRSYQPNRNTKLSSHIYSRLQSLQRAALKQKNVVDVSERYYNEKNKIKHKLRDFQDINDRDPSDSELADLTGLSPKRIRFINGINNGTISESASLDNSAAAGKDVSLPGVSGQNPEDVWASYVHHDATPTDQLILEWKTGYNGKELLTNTEIAERLKITPAAVSQRAKKLSIKIAEGYK